MGALSTMTETWMFGTFGAIYVGADVAVPLAILAGLSRERLFMGQALVELPENELRIDRISLLVRALVEDVVPDLALFDDVLLPRAVFLAPEHG